MKIGNSLLNYNFNKIIPGLNKKIQSDIDYGIIDNKLDQILWFDLDAMIDLKPTIEYNLYENWENS